MKALSLDQPYASLCVTHQPCGQQGHEPSCSCRSMVKRIETRSWQPPPALIGQRIALHATRRKPSSLQDVGDWQIIPDGADGRSMRHGPTFKASPAFDNIKATVHAIWPETAEARAAGHVRLPLGAIVGSAIIEACYPIVGYNDCETSAHVCRFGESLTLHLDLVSPGETEFDVSDQLPYGDFTPGRYAWLLADAAPVQERCPWCCGNGWVHGAAIGLGPMPTCKVCDGAGRCEPIPARGRQRIWNWTP